MTCTEFSKYLDDYMINNLSDDLSDKMRVHIESCEKCRAEYEFAEKIAGHLHNMDKARVSDDFLDKVNKCIDAQNYSDNKFHINFNSLKLKKLIANRKFLTGAAAACLFAVIIAKINMPDISRKKSDDFSISENPVSESSAKPRKTSAPKPTDDNDNSSNHISFNDLRSLAEKQKAEKAEKTEDTSEKEKSENSFLDALLNGRSSKNNAASDNDASFGASSENSASSQPNMFQRSDISRTAPSDTNAQANAQANDSDTKSRSDTNAFLAIAEKRRNAEAADTTDTTDGADNAADGGTAEKASEQQINIFSDKARSNSSEAAGTNQKTAAPETAAPQSTNTSEMLNMFRQAAANPKEAADEASYAVNSAPVSNSQNKVSDSSEDGIPAAAGGSSGRTSSSSGGGGGGGSSGGSGSSAVIGSVSKITLSVSDRSAAGDILSKYSQTSDGSYYTVYRSELSKIYDELSEKDIDYSISYKYENNSDTIIITLK